MPFPFAYRQQADIGGISGSTGHFTSATLAGSLLFCTVAVQSNSNSKTVAAIIPTITLSTPGISWIKAVSGSYPSTLIANAFNIAGANAFYYASNAPSIGTGVLTTLSATAGGQSITVEGILIEITGISTASNPVDGIASAFSATSGIPNAGNITTTFTSDFLLVQTTFAGSPPSLPGSGFGGLISGNEGLQLVEQSNFAGAPSATYQCKFGNSSNNAWSCIAISFGGVGFNQGGGTQQPIMWISS